MKPYMCVWLMGTFFAFWETAHFGWNSKPLSDAEVICDGISMLICALAVLTYAIEKQRTTVNVTNKF